MNRELSSASRAPVSRPLFASLVVLAAISAGPAFAQTKTVKVDPAKGRDIASKVCVACHGADGNSMVPQYPKLAGQHAEYLYKQLTDFHVKPGAKAPERPNAVMGGIAMTLSDEDMRSLALYFSQQKLNPSSAKDRNLVEAGQAIYRGGIAAKKVPACAGCHGPSGAGIPAQYPRIGGQWADYVQAQLTAFRQGVRNNSPQMSAIAGRLSDAEIKAVADYVAGLR